jgi:hypothetical protein
MNAKEFISQLSDEGFSMNEIIEAASDGEVLKQYNVNQEEAEEVIYCLSCNVI